MTLERSARNCPTGVSAPPFRLTPKTEDQREDNQRKHGFAAQQSHEVLSRKETDNQLRDGFLLVNLADSHIFPWLQNRRNQFHQDDHNSGRNSSCDEKRRDCGPHDFPGAFAAFHIGHCAGDGGEDHGNDNAEHQIDENLSQRSENGCAGALNAAVGSLDAWKNPADNTAQDDSADHQEQKTVVFPDGSLFHKSSFSAQQASGTGHYII